MKAEITLAELDALAELEKGATPLPWKPFRTAYPDGNQEAYTFTDQITGPNWPIAYIIYDDEKRPLLPPYDETADPVSAREDFDLIWKLRNAAPALIAMARRVVELESAKVDHDEAIDNARAEGIREGMQLALDRMRQRNEMEALNMERDNGD